MRLSTSKKIRIQIFAFFILYYYPVEVVYIYLVHSCIVEVVVLVEHSLVLEVFIYRIPKLIYSHSVFNVTVYVL